MEACKAVRKLDLLNFSSSGAEGQRLTEGKRQVKVQAGQLLEEQDGPLVSRFRGSLLRNEEYREVGPSRPADLEGCSFSAKEPRPVAFG